MENEEGPTFEPVIQELRRLQAEHNELESHFNEELTALKKKFEAQKQPLYESRTKLLTGDGGKPTVERFWLSVLKANDVTAPVITEKDEEVLSHLTDIRVHDVYTTTEDGQSTTETGFELTFFFADNPFFSEAQLTKKYNMSDEDEDMLESAEGCSISWKPGKNVTVKVMKKKAKAGGRGQPRVVTKTEKVPSFFDFFAPPRVPSEDEEVDEEQMEELQGLLEADYEVGDILRRSIIPYAVSWYTGELMNDEEEEEEEDDEEDEDEDEDEDDDSEDEDDEEEDDDDEKAPARGHHKAKHGAPKATNGFHAAAGQKGAKPPGATLPGPGGEKEECKQQ